MVYGCVTAGSWSSKYSVVTLYFGNVLLCGNENGINLGIKQIKDL